MGSRTYRETFDQDTGGWHGFISNAKGPKLLEFRPGGVTSRSPWWVDYNHAPPGAGYLHLPFSLQTTGSAGEHLREVAGPNHFVAGGHPTDFTDARMTARLRGELHLRGAHLVLLVQGRLDGVRSAWVLTGQPLQVGTEWADQTLDLSPDSKQWSCLGARSGREDMYGEVPLPRLLSNVNVNIILVLFPLDVKPMGPIDGDPHVLRPQKDYPIWHGLLPEGYISMAEIRIDFPAR